MGKYSLDNYGYDEHLARNKKEKELIERRKERKLANKGYEGWHFGIDTVPVYTKDKDDFKHELDRRGLVMRDDVKKELKNGRIYRKAA